MDHLLKLCGDSMVLGQVYGGVAGAHGHLDKRKLAESQSISLALWWFLLIAHRVVVSVALLSCMLMCS